jgi:hypothetical protein
MSNELIQMLDPVVLMTRKSHMKLKYEVNPIFIVQLNNITIP